MGTSGEENRKTENRKDGEKYRYTDKNDHIDYDYSTDSSGVNIDNILSKKAYLNREIYRNIIKNKENFCWRVVYKNTELIISCDKDIKNLIAKPLSDIYRQLKFVIEKDSSFLKSFSPVIVKSFYPPAIKEMCRLSSEFGVGPMASVAGTVNEYLAANLGRNVKNLFIENGGDLYIKSKRDIKTGVFIKNSFFKNNPVLKIKASSTPCSLCSSSGTFGHSFSMGKCDIAVALSPSSISADAAATAIANSVSRNEDIEKAIEKFKRFSSIRGILIIKDDRIGIWGKFELDYH